MKAIEEAVKALTGTKFHVSRLELPFVKSKIVRLAAILMVTEGKSADKRVTLTLGSLKVVITDTTPDQDFEFEKRDTT